MGLPLGLLVYLGRGLLLVGQPVAIDIDIDLDNGGCADTAVVAPIESLLRPHRLEISGGSVQSEGVPTHVAAGPVAVTADEDVGAAVSVDIAGGQRRGSSVRPPALALLRDKLDIRAVPLIDTDSV